MTDSDPAATFAPFLNAFAPLGCAYVHLLDMKLEHLDAPAFVRRHFSGALVVNNMVTQQNAAELVRSGRADAISFGRAFIANPDLVQRMRIGAAFAKPDFSLLYTGEERGYIDYPTLAE